MDAIAEMVGIVYSSGYRVSSALLRFSPLFNPFLFSIVAGIYPIFLEVMTNQTLFLIVSFLALGYLTRFLFRHLWIVVILGSIGGRR